MFAPLRSGFYVIARVKINAEVQSYVGSEATPSRCLKTFQSIFMCVQRRQDLLPTQRDTEWARKDNESENTDQSRLHVSKLLLCVHFLNSPVCCVKGAV